MSQLFVAFCPSPFLARSFCTVLPKHTGSTPQWGETQRLEKNILLGHYYALLSRLGLASVSPSVLECGSGVLAPGEATSAPWAYGIVLTEHVVEETGDTIVNENGTKLGPADLQGDSGCIAPRPKLHVHLWDAFGELPAKGFQDALALSQVGATQARPATMLVGQPATELVEPCRLASLYPISYGKPPSSRPCYKQSTTKQICAALVGAGRCTLKRSLASSQSSLRMRVPS